MHFIFHELLTLLFKFDPTNWFTLKIMQIFNNSSVPYIHCCKKKSCHVLQPVRRIKRSPAQQTFPTAAPIDSFIASSSHHGIIIVGAVTEGTIPPPTTSSNWIDNTEECAVLEISLSGKSHTIKSTLSGHYIWIKITINGGMILFSRVKGNRPTICGHCFVVSFSACVSAIFQG